MTPTPDPEAPQLSTSDPRENDPSSGRPETPQTRAALRRAREAAEAAARRTEAPDAAAPRHATDSAPLPSDEVREDARPTIPAPAGVRSRRTPPETSAAPGPVAPIRSRRRRVGEKILSVGTLAVVSSFMVGMTIPAVTAGGTQVRASSRSGAPETTSPATASDGSIQAFVVPDDTPAVDLGRESVFSVASAPQLAAAAGIRNFTGSLLLDPDAEVQWPFPVSVPTSSNFGPRWGRQHEGADFTPGEGSQIRAVAGGIVRIATEQGAAFGVTVYIESVVDGKTVFSRYAHMLAGSLGVREGEQVSAGQVVGRVGNTGRSFGAHLHLEITTDDGKIDPVAWLQEQTSG